MSKETNLTFAADGYTKDLIVYDFEYIEYFKNHKKIGKNIEKVRGKYIKILRTLSKELNGKLSDNICYFAENMDVITKNVISETYESQSTYMNDYIAAIDKADKAFF